MVIASPWLSCANRAERDAVPSSFVVSASKMGGGPGGGGGGGGGERHGPLLRTDRRDMWDATGPCVTWMEIIFNQLFKEYCIMIALINVRGQSWVSVTPDSHRFRRSGTITELSAVNLSCSNANRARKADRPHCYSAAEPLYLKCFYKMLVKTIVKYL